MNKCRECGNVDLKEIINEEGSMHYSKLVCPECDDRFVTWGKKPENKDVVNRKNVKWKKQHFEELGKYQCVWCGVDERILSNPKGWMYQVDHINPLSEGGKDEFDNTQILCWVCHADKTYSRQRVQAILQSMEKASQKGGQ